jgi:hypothetical protein
VHRNVGIEVIETVKTVGRTWSMPKDVPSDRNGHTSTLVGDLLYVVGGISDDPDA